MKTKGLLGILFLLFGLYFINSSLNFLEMPQVVLDVEKWLSLFGGILLVLGAFNSFKLKRYNM